MTAPQTDATTDPQSIIVALRQQLDAALSEKAALAEALATRNSEFGERIEQQSATIDVLKVMSASPGDPLPVFDLIVRRAQELCNSKAAGIYEYDGELVHLRAHYGDRDIGGHATYFAAFPMMPIRGSIPCRAILDKQVVHIPDTGAEPELLPIVRDLGIRSVLAIPLLRDGAAIGAFTINSIELGGFSDSQVALSQTFAEQAVIALTSAETYRALQTRTSDLQEALEYQTATSDVLKVISRSTFDLQPVLDALVETAARLCNADQAVLARSDGKVAWLASNFGFPTEYEAYVRSFGIFPVDEHSPLVAFRALCGRHVVHIHDVAAVPNYPDHPIRLGKQRTSLGVPLLREGEPAGVIVLARQRVEPFTDRQIELVSTFAAQAVIAIENTRLLTEQREALEQQTATAEVLQVINASPGNLAPVFDAMLEKAIRLCGGDRGVLWTIEGGRGRLAAARGLPAEFVALLRERAESGTNSPLQRVVQGEWLIEFPDTVEEFSRSGDPHAKGAVEAGVRSAIWVAIVKEGVTVGAFAIGRSVIGTFSDKQIVLLQNFAAQAVIAMENARLLTETREALEQQTATAEVLEVINSSPGDLGPVFQALLRKAHTLCEASFGALMTYDGEQFHAVAHQGTPAPFREFLGSGLLPGPGDPFGLMVEGAAYSHIHDLLEVVARYPGEPLPRAAADLGGIRTLLVVPLRKDSELLGVITAYRQETRPFSDKQIALLQNFAAQAVIAMENARLITEQREALEQQTATAEVLQVINASPGNLAPVFDAMLEKAMRLCGGTMGGILTFDGDHSVTSAVRGVTVAFQEYNDSYPNDRYPMDKIQPGTVPARVIETRGPVQNPDLTAGENYRAGHPYARALVELGGIRAVLAVPLLKDDVAVGMVAIYRQEAGAFSDKEIALLQNFAAQAVIAMENARLLTEQQEALEQQTATAEVLQVINSSPGNLAPVFDAMLEKAMHLCGAAFGTLRQFDGEQAHILAARGLPTAFAEHTARHPVTPRDGLLRSLGTGQPLPTLDIRDLELYKSGDPDLRAIGDLGGARTVLNVPLFKAPVSIGYFTLYRQDVRAFTDKQIALLENFAAQAVIAMENARLITEQREALEQQTATAEVLQVINASPGDLTPVFDAMLDRARKLCGADVGTFWYRDGPSFRVVASSAQGDTGRTVIPAPGTSLDRIAHGADVVQIDDVTKEEGYRTGVWRERTQRVGTRTALAVPLRKDDELVGAITTGRREVRRFTENQIGLLQNFAAQAVIAMENARLLDEIRQRQAELRVTFDNMGDGVVMFDAEHRLAASNRNFQELLDIPDAALAKRPSYADYLRLLAERGEFGVEDIEADLARRLGDTDRELRLERTRPDGRVIELRRNPVPDGGFVLIYSDISERKRSEAEIRAARDAAEAAYRDLKAAQANLIQAEKMASLGQLTAGIAHEIKNPLNFVNNFSALSTELIDELRDVLAPEPLGETARTEVEGLTALLKGNLEKVVQHGQRADGIVRSMLDHSRGSSGERRKVDINTLADEALNLAYHGARAQDQSFNITLERDFGTGIAPIEVNPQDMTRVFLNVFSNGFHATTRRARDGGDAEFVPTLKVTTRDAGDAVEIRVRDNGTGIPADIRDKLFQPFFTTKPTGEGTGLGLSITYDIVTQQHGGDITVDSEVGEYSEFVIRLPRKP